MFDFIVVGAGLAGISFANFLEKYQKSFCIISNFCAINSVEIHRWLLPNS